MTSQIMDRAVNESLSAPPLSYAQNMEDYHLWLALGGGGPGVYIDIGGGHPVADNVSCWFYERGWSGIIVEPQSVLAGLYAHVRPRDRVYDGLIGREVGTCQLHVFSRLHGLSTTVLDNAQSSRVHGDDYISQERPMLTLAALCENYRMDRIDFLKIDVEGAEADVLAGNDWNRFRPRIVAAEAIDPATNTPTFEKWEPILLQAGYRFRLDDTLNRFYVAEECPDVMEKLPATRAAWDAVTHMYEIGRAPEQVRHPDHALTEELARGFWALLPTLDRKSLARMLTRSRGLDPDGQEAAQLLRELDTDTMRIALGRIACGYDGGQIV
ncbi:MAG: FkbM family methyltransferase [Hyphomicrobiaceae bacterium]